MTELSYEFSNKIEKKSLLIGTEYFLLLVRQKGLSIDLNYPFLVAVRHVVFIKSKRITLIAQKSAILLIRDKKKKKSNKHMANGYKKLVHTFKLEAV